MEPSNGYIAERVQETKACLHTIHSVYILIFLVGMLMFSTTEDPIRSLDRFAGELLGYWIRPSIKKGMVASGDSGESQGSSLENSMPTDRFNHVARTGRGIDAGGWKPR